MYQFVHVESYSRSTPKKAGSVNKKTGKASAKSSGHCVKYVVDEAIREASSIPHIENPMPPEYVFGEPLETLEQACNDWANSLKDGRGHAVRKDALCLLAGVVSAPKDIAPEAWEAFQKDSLEWLQAKYGKALRTVIAHHDESHPHLHFYCVPELGQRFDTIHQGRAASAEVAAAGGVKGLQNQAYKAAMREYQNEFYDRVGIEHGFTRIGPAKRRLTREEWKLEQIQAAAAAHAINKANNLTEISKVQSAEMIEVAKNEAKAVAEKALINADNIEKQARKKGWQAALDAFEKLPWFKRVQTVVARAVTQRDALQTQVQTLTESAKTWREKAQNYFAWGKKYATDSRDLAAQLTAKEDDLKALQPKAAEVDRLREKNEALEDRLEGARGRIQHLEATVEALQPKVPERPAVKRQETAPGASLDA